MATPSRRIAVSRPGGGRIKPEATTASRPTESEFRAEYDRIGARTDEPWPAPPCGMSEAEVLRLLRRVPTGSGLTGWLKVLRSAPAE